MDLARRREMQHRGQVVADRDRDAAGLFDTREAVDVGQVVAEEHGDAADEWRLLSVPEYRQWRNAVAGLGVKADAVFTHNQMGDYGHPHHMTVHRIAHELYSPVWDFYVEAESSVGAQIARGPVSEVPVTDEKTTRFHDTYGADVLEELWRDRPELLADLFRSEKFTGPELL